MEILHRAQMEQDVYNTEYACTIYTYICTGLIKIVIAHYNVNDTEVFGCFLDASKAFDRVDHSVRFEKLLKRNLPPCIVRTLLTWYSCQKATVKWNSCYSSKFPVTNGVRQERLSLTYTVYNLY